MYVLCLSGMDLEHFVKAMYRKLKWFIPSRVSGRGNNKKYRNLKNLNPLRQGIGGGILQGIQKAYVHIYSSYLKLNHI